MRITVYFTFVLALACRSYYVAGQNATTTAPVEVSDSPTTTPVDDVPTPTSGVATIITDGDPCWKNLTTLVADLESKSPFEDKVYTLCPNTTYEIGIGDPKVDTPEMMTHLFLRSNTIYQCGTDGSSKNNCILNGGNFHVFATASSFGLEPIHNTVLKGITFQGAKAYNVIVVNYGDLSFIDCIFRDNMNGAIFAFFQKAPEERLRKQRSLQDSDGSSELTPEEIQKNTINITIDNCTFVDNTIVDADVSRYSMLFAMEEFHDVFITNTLFINNTILEPTIAGISSKAGIYFEERNYLEMNNVCFIGNNFPGDGVVDVYASDIGPMKNIYVSNVKTDLNKCQFIHTRDNGECIEADLTSCPLLSGGGSGTDTPTSPNGGDDKANTTNADSGSYNIQRSCLVMNMIMLVGSVYFAVTLIV